MLAANRTEMYGKSHRNIKTQAHSIWQNLQQVFCLVFQYFLITEISQRLQMSSLNDSSNVRWFMCWLWQLGTLGAGNHYAEIQIVDEIYNEFNARKMGIEETGQVCVMIHCGSRGLGHQVATGLCGKVLFCWIYSCFNLTVVPETLCFRTTTCFIFLC